MHQFYIDCLREECKYATLVDLLSTINVGQAIVFCNTAATATRLAEQLRARDHFSASAVHGLTDASEARAALERFGLCVTRVLVITDGVAADMPTWAGALIINYDLPDHLDDYVARARIGRRGKYTRQGVAISLVTEVRELAEYYKVVIPPLPADTEVARPSCKRTK
ncbi:eukaryotic initiation factor 4, putative [Acanthamoeba castellanii str. Neff]|uniref:Eukaryotic initiation factor 4, putative n=1 Tax=Acanthamoeba castellanii (strain ATCC 30010 / Neff) TaxID=1257118 RepID=L8GNB0_ACACF|nr:eukaryotic initiation factor 4, putative [Acanthamoeba castellanii str. Neff]ELR14550.1 eukaryotic initiation factor 4, putative [Acanthamoeba castellanii str. Neff]